MATPEPRDRMVRRSRPGETIGTASYLDLLREAAGVDFQFQAAKGKENVSIGRPSNAVRRRSALPVWYPRTPLRDVTAIVNALERRRTALRLAARQRRQSGQISSPIRLVENSSPDPSTRAGDKSPTTCCQPIGSSSQPIADGESSPRTPFPAPEDASRLLELEMKLEKSIEAIEKAVKENMRRMPKAKKDEKAERLRSLRAMR